MTKLQKLHNWLKQPLTKKEVKTCTYVMSGCFVFDIISAVIEFKLKFDSIGVMDILFSLIPLGIALICAYHLKTNFKEEK